MRDVGSRVNITIGCVTAPVARGATEQAAREKRVRNFIAGGLSSVPPQNNKSINKAPRRLAGCFVYGAANRIRTDDLVITNDVLYRLSYSSVSLYATLIL